MNFLLNGTYLIKKLYSTAFKCIRKFKYLKEKKIYTKVSCCSEMCQTGQIKVSGQGGRHLMYYPRKSDFLSSGFVLFHIHTLGIVLLSIHTFKGNT